MYLHEDKDIFIDAVQKTREETGIEPAIIEKDYYVSMMLRLLAASNIGFVFKGGTSLSKAYKVIERFSEDIDLTVTTKPTQGQRIKMVDTVLECAKQLRLRIVNPAQLRHRGQFNKFIFEYDSVFRKSVISPQIIVEIFVTLLAFPTEEKMISSFVGETVEKYNNGAALEYNLLAFTMPVQDIRRTFIDKVFALCDYYLEGKSERYSRHIYDINQILTKIPLADISRQLVDEVCQERLKDSRCLSVKEGMNPSALLTEIVEKDFFKDDYNDKTEKLLYKFIPYDQVIESIKEIIKSGVFTS